MIGLLFGDTDFPKLILKRLKKTKKKYLILDLSRKNIFKKDSKSFRVNIGQFGSILKLLRENKCLEADLCCLIATRSQWKCVFP